MLNATGFVAAGVIVALVGGVVLTGLLSRPREEDLPAIGASASAAATASAAAAVDEPSVAPSLAAAQASAADLLPGVELEEVQAGVYKVLGDGTGHPFEEIGHVVVTADGDVWASIGECADGVFLLGAPGRSSGLGEGGGGCGELLLDAEGRPRIHHRSGNRDRNNSAVFADGRWVKKLPDISDQARRQDDLTIAADGSRWETRDGAVIRTDELGETVFTRDDMGFDPDMDRVDGQPELRPGQIASSPDGHVWVSWTSHRGGGPVESDTPFAVTEFDGDSWRVIRRDGWLDGDYVAEYGFYVENRADLDVGPDGTLWTTAFGYPRVYEVTTWDGRSWQEVAKLPPAAGQGLTFDVDGAAWFGAARLDRSPLRSIEVPTRLQSRLVHAPNGAIWATVPNGRDRGLYVIDPELAETRSLDEALEGHQERVAAEQAAREAGS